MKRVLGLAAAAGMGVVTSVSAQVTGFTFTPTFSDDGTKVANVIAVDFVGRYTGSQILLELTEGQILQELAFGSDVDVAPTSGLAAAAGGLQFDTYFALGDVFSDTPKAAGAPNLGGGAVNIRRSDASPVWNDPTTISQSTNLSGIRKPLDRTNFVIAQIALSSDAQGTFQFFTSANDEVLAPDEIPVYTIRDGVILIPEPTLVGVFGLGLLVVRRRARAGR